MFYLTVPAAVPGAAALGAGAQLSAGLTAVEADVGVAALLLLALSLGGPVSYTHLTLPTIE